MGPNCEIHDPCMGNPCGEGNLCLRGEGTSFQCMCPCAAGGACQNTGNGDTDSGSSGTESGESGGADSSGGENTVPQVGGPTDGTDSGLGSDGGSTGGGSTGSGSESGGTGSGSLSKPCVTMMLQTNNCNNRGSCIEDNTGAFCRCYQGYRGVNCQYVDEGNSGSGSTSGSGGSGPDSGAGSSGTGQTGTGDAGTESGSSGSSGSSSGSGDSGTGSGQGSGTSGGSGSGGSGNTLPQVGGGSAGGGRQPSTTQPCAVMMRQTNNCSNNQGYCEEDATGAFCHCNDGFMGVICSERIP